jgi:REP element-mobilizing transposase RayT
MDNHFHLMIRVKSEDEIIRYIKSLAEKRRTAAQKKIFLEGCDEVNLHRVIERQFTRLFTSYAMRFNGFFNRNGNLFHRPFKRVVITSEAHFTFLIYYINANPLKHGLLEDFRNYRWSSYQSILSDGYTHLKRKEILEWFGGRDAFKAYHDLGERYWKENADYLLIE